MEVRCIMDHATKTTCIAVDKLCMDVCESGVPTCLCNTDGVAGVLGWAGRIQYHMPTPRPCLHLRRCDKCGFQRRPCFSVLEWLLPWHAPARNHPWLYASALAWSTVMGRSNRVCTSRAGFAKSLTSAAVQGYRSTSPSPSALVGGAVSSQTAIVGSSSRLEVCIPRSSVNAVARCVHVLCVLCSSSISVLRWCV